MTTSGLERVAKDLQERQPDTEQKGTQSLFPFLTVQSSSTDWHQFQEEKSLISQMPHDEYREELTSSPSTIELLLSNTYQTV